METNYDDYSKHADSYGWMINGSGHSRLPVSSIAHCKIESVVGIYYSNAPPPDPPAQDGWADVQTGFAG